MNLPEWIVGWYLEWFERAQHGLNQIENHLPIILELEKNSSASPSSGLVTITEYLTKLRDLYPSEQFQSL
jgi:hypothetical protein